MRVRYTILSLVIVAALGLTAALAQDEGASQQEMQAKMMELAQPGPEHELLEKLTGKWNMTVKMYMAPGQEPMVFNGSSEAETILGGRFLQSKWVSGEGPMETRGVSIMGYDRRHEEYTALGLDTWGTYFVTAQGPMDEETNTITMAGTDEDPVFNMLQEYEFVMTLVDDDTFTWDVIFYNPEMTQGQDSFKMVEITYERAR
ncbi:DUF1579 domain-containing protein [candidate division GN15 bacterium]|nr:DUF1579 domain-containing protein [candidate division GN15 bacterium]